MFLINLKDLDYKNSASKRAIKNIIEMNIVLLIQDVYRADFFYYDDELMVKDIELVEKKSEEYLLTLCFFM